MTTARDELLAAQQATTRRQRGAQATTPLADAGIAVGLAGLRVGQRVDNGIVVVDRQTGDALGFQPTMVSNADFSFLLGLESSDVLVALVQPNDVERLIVRWSWKERTLNAVAVVHAEMISWAGPMSALPN
jgi:hypothetical protein